MTDKRTASSAALAGLVLAVLLALSAPARAQPAGTVEALIGGAQVFRAGAVTPEAVSVGAALFEGDRIETALRARARLSLADGTVVALGSESSLTIERMAREAGGSSLLDMTYGVVRMVVAAVLPQASFELRTRTAIASVRGTDWLAEVTPTATAMVVVEGSLQVTGLDETVTLGPGEGTTIIANRAPRPPSRWGEARIEGLIEATAVP